MSKQTRNENNDDKAFKFDISRLKERKETFKGDETVVMSYITPLGFDISKRHYIAQLDADPDFCRISDMKDSFYRHVDRLSATDRNRWRQSDEQ